MPNLIFAMALLGGPPAPFEQSQVHMGTLVKVTLYAPDEPTARRAMEAAFARVAHLDKGILSDYAPESELSRLSAAAGSGPRAISPELFAVLAEAKRMDGLSGGAFDVTMAPVVRLWRNARRIRRLPAPEKLAAARALVGGGRLRLDPAKRTAELADIGMALDLGGLAKGYVGDEVIRLLRGMGLPAALVSCGGDVVAGDAPPGTPGWRVAVARLADGDAPAGSLELTLANAAASTSGDARQFVVIGGKRYSHIVDPRTGLGLSSRLQATVVAPTGLRADALDTAIAILGTTKGLAFADADPQVAALCQELGDDGKLKVTPSKRWRERYSR